MSSDHMELMRLYVMGRRRPTISFDWGTIWRHWFGDGPLRGPVANDNRRVRILTRC